MKNMKELCVEELLQNINEFRAWQEARLTGQSAYEDSGEWETWYGGWPKINTAFSKVLQETEPETADKHLLDEMIYIIARDNECELLMEELAAHPKWFGLLCQHSLRTDEVDARWQFAVYLPRCECGPEIKELILTFVEDPDEYVCRRALLAMQFIYPDKAAHYAELFWNRDLYDPILQEYQRMAALTVLHKVHSPLYDVYLEKAKADGRKYLCKCVEEIEKERREQNGTAIYNEADD